MADYCWCLKRDSKSSEFVRKTKEENSQKSVLVWLTACVFE